MKIVMICRLYAPHIGGVERHVAGISKEAIKEGHTVDVFTLKHEPTLARSETIDGVRVHRVKISGDWICPKGTAPAYAGMTEKILARVVLWTWMLANIRTFILADVIQIHDVFYWYWPIRLLLPWKKVFITYHGFEAGCLPTQKAKRTRQMIQRWTNGSMAIGSWIEKWYGTKPDVISYGAGECGIHDNWQMTKDQSSIKIECVFVGRISEDTGAKVYQKVIGASDNCRLDMYGEGSKLGTIGNTCMVFPKYDIACVSSYLAIIEAMQSQTLVVAYAADDLKYDYLMAHPRARDMIIVRSSQELSDFLSTYSPEDYAEQVESAYTWARQQTWNRVYLKYKKLWQSK